MNKVIAVVEEQVSFSPLLDQYFALKKEVQDGLLLFRVGDFYEAYGEDAVLLSKALDIVLTSREVRGNRVSMAGVPHHSIDNHLKTLLSAGHRVAISEQMEEASEKKGLIRRDIVRYLTPGTVFEENFLTATEPNYLLAVVFGKENYGLTWCDVSTGHWLFSSIPAEISALHYEISKLAPKEIVMFETQESGEVFSAFPGIKLSRISDSNRCEPPLAITGSAQALEACALLYGYLKKIYCGHPPTLNPPEHYESRNYLVLDSPTVRNLELFHNLATGERQGSLQHLLDYTETSMGSRYLRQWLLHPLLNLKEIERRQDAVDELIRFTGLSEIQRSLSGLGDLERLSARIAYNTANARDLLAIHTILEAVPKLSSQLSSLKSEFFKSLSNDLPDFSVLTDLLGRALAAEPPLGLKEGGLIKPGYHEELDLIKRGLSDALNWISELEERERKTTGIKSLKVGFNQIFGYFLEVTRSNLTLVPQHYIRKQTLSNCERYIIEELKSHESKIFGGQERAKNLEYEIFCGIRDEVKEYEERLRKLSQVLATVDVLASLALAAKICNFSRPNVNDGESIAIRNGRHPVVEAAGLGAFVPNDLFLDSADHRLMILTGPNMAGKSTYLRQAALIVILAQIGSFVPAEGAEIGIVDRVFTRIGASDDLHRGQSTFFVEMKETAEILKKATRRSLVLLDEIGRGTSTFDGLSLAWATAEELLYRKAKVMFATHYHEMTSLSLRLQGVKNFTVLVKEENDQVHFLRKIVPGGADKSYGIAVAGLAGIPEAVVSRARQVLKELEEGDISKKIKNRQGTQLSFFQPVSNPILEELKTVDLNQLSGLEALNLLDRWKKKCGESPS